MFNFKAKSTELLENFKFSDSLSEIFNIVSRSNKYIDETMPWILAKDESKVDELNSVLYHLVENLRITAVLLRPYLEDTSKEIFRQLNIGEDLQTYESIKEYGKILNIKVISKGEPIFARLDVEEEIKYMIEQMKNS